MGGHPEGVVIGGDRAAPRRRTEPRVDRVRPRVDADDEILLGAHPDVATASGDVTIGGFYTGHRKGGSLSLTARPNDKLNLGLRFGYNDVRLREGNFQVSLVGLRLAYAFTPRIYLQSLTQYNHQSESLSANIRFSWLGPAGTGLFVVFNEGRTTGEPSGVQERALVVKFTRQVDLR